MSNAQLDTVLAFVAVLSALGCAASSGADDSGTLFKPVQVSGGGGSQSTGGGSTGGLSGGGWASGGSAGDSSTPCAPGEEQDCYSGDPSTLGVGTCAAGTRVCNNGVWGACTGEVLPSTEVCDGALDESCDGQVDEGCCTTTQYKKDTGLVSGSGSVCCDGADHLVDAHDCGVGNNHTYSVSGDCATAIEGAGNDGSACVRVTCEKTQCQ